jgi:hypothetical protein
MSLIASLDRIMSWMIANQPIYAESFLPGLSRQEIDSICEVIPGCLSEDIYQLYQWRNGTNEEYWRWMWNFHLHYQPLQEVVETCLAIIEIGSDDIGDDGCKFDGKYIFPFFHLEKNYYCTLISEGISESSVIVDLYAGGGVMDIVLAFNSLTCMLEMLAEGLDTGVFFLDEGNDFAWDQNKNDVQMLFYKYNASDVECIF